MAELGGGRSLGYAPRLWGCQHVAGVLEGLPGSPALVWSPTEHGG